MNDVGQSMHHHTSTTLFSSFLVAVFWIHLFLAKITIIIFEATVIQSKQFAKDLTLYLLHKVIDRIPIDKSTFLGIVSMEVKIERQAIALDKMRSQLFDGIDGWLFLERRVEIVPI